MTSLLLLSLVLLPADSPPPECSRRTHPLAPSLPVLSKEEETRIEKVIERFILYDTGKLPKSEGPKALRELMELGPEAFFQLVDGFNRAAAMKESCPAVVLGRKLASIINSTDDLDLLAFARENLGREGTARRHLGVVKDLRLACTLRRAAVQRQEMAIAPRLRPLTTEQLAQLAASQRVPQLKFILTELEKRRDPGSVDGLAAAVERKDEEARELGRAALVRALGRLPGKELKERLKDKRPAVRAAAAQAVGDRGHRFGEELIDLLEDDNAAVQQAARCALVRLSGRDFGPRPNAGSSERVLAIEQWREWWRDARK